MKKQIKMMGVAMAAAGTLTGPVQAEFGVGIGAAFKYDADFSSKAEVQPRATDPGAATGGTDHFYDDGFNRVSSLGTMLGLTSYWGYDDASQYDSAGNGSIAMNSAQTTIDAASSSSVDGEDFQPVVQLYWNYEFSEKEGRRFGLRSALRWQQIEIDGQVNLQTTIDTITDTYAGPGVGWVPLAPGVDGSFSGPNALLTDVPVRTTSSAAGEIISASRKLEADLFAFDLGPTLSFDVSKSMRLVGSAGGTLGWVMGDFSYTDGDYANGSDSESSFTYGVYAELDLQFMLGDRWGWFAGLSANYMDEVEFSIEGRSADLNLTGCSCSGGVFFR